MLPRQSMLGPLAALMVLTAMPGLAQSVTELYVTPDTLRLAVGNRQALTVQAFDDAGNAVLSFTFKSDDPAVAPVGSNGSVMGGRGGRARITVQAGDKTKTVVVIVAGGIAPPTVAATPAPRPAPAPSPVVARLTAEPASLTLMPGQRVPVTVRAFRADGTVLPTPELFWRTVNPAIAGLSIPRGDISGVSSGETTVEVAISAGMTVTIPVTVASGDFRLSVPGLVLAPDDRDSVTATLGTRPVAASVLQWSAADPGVLDVGPDGRVRALAAGRTELIVRGFSQERRIPVVVHRRVAHFVVAPRLGEPVRMMIDSKREFTALPQTADSIPIESAPVVWTLSDSSVVSFDNATGVVTALRGGTTTLSFAARGVAPAGWTIDVLPGALSLSSVRLTLHPAERHQLTATFVDPQAKPVGAATNLAWTTTDAGVAKVSATGEVTGVAPGRASITAIAPGGKPVTAAVLVTGDLLLSSSRSGTFGIYALAAGAPEQFIPVVVDSSNNVDPTYSPDRTRLAYASDRGGSLDLYVAEADGKNPVRLTSDAAPESEPAWTPDGRRLVFTATRGGSRQLYVISAAGGEARQLTSLPGGAAEPVVSPDGVTVAFSGAQSPREATDIFTIPLSGGMPTAVTATKDRREMDPSYLPSGVLTWLVQRKDKKEPDQVLQQPRSGVTTAPLFFSALAVQDVALSRDGSRIAWVASRTAEGKSAVPEFTLQWRTLSNGAETSVRLLPGERITSPTF